MQENEGVNFEDGGEGSVTVDLSGTEDAGFEQVPRGQYECEVDELEYKLSESSGRPMWAVTLRITEGEYENRKLFYNMSFAEKALPMTKRAMTVLAPELLEGPFDPEKVADDGELIGRRVRAQVVLKKWEGELRSNVRRIMESEASEFVG